MKENTAHTGNQTGLKHYEFNIRVFDQEDVEICSCLVNLEQVVVCFCAFIDSYTDYLFCIERNKRPFCSGRLNNDFLDEVNTMVLNIAEEEKRTKSNGNALNDSYSFENMAICSHLKKKCHNEYALLIKTVVADDELAYRAAGRALCVYYGKRRLLLLYGKKEPVLIDGIVGVDPVKQPAEYFIEAKKLVNRG